MLKSENSIRAISKFWSAKGDQGIFTCKLAVSPCVMTQAVLAIIIPTIPGKADNYELLLKKGRDNFFKKGRLQTA